ncbi:hypothetical protein JCM19297_1876 [Nonlabens ulvanivorans]|nr:hypothetical protein JCM19297_1876 [Nonlabens ulvanivorans]
MRVPAAVLCGSGQVWPIIKSLFFTRQRYENEESISFTK